MKLMEKLLIFKDSNELCISTRNADSIGSILEPPSSLIALVFELEPVGQRFRDRHRLRQEQHPGTHGQD
jgi:hypothetical protein